MRDGCGGARVGFGGVIPSQRGSVPKPPPLPRGLADPRPAVGVGTVIWFAAALALLMFGGPAAWIWACLAGGLLGFVGFVMIHWQRRAAQRGARSAQRDIL